jgi:hypothetical protein
MSDNRELTRALEIGKPMKREDVIPKVLPVHAPTPAVPVAPSQPTKEPAIPR